MSLGSVARYLGLLAATCGYEQADEHLEDAVAVNERHRRPAWAALALDDRAVLRGDREPGRAGGRAYTELGMDVLAARAALLR